MASIRLRSREAWQQYWFAAVAPTNLAVGRALFFGCLCDQKRIEILTKRLEKFDKISENRKVVDAQCSAVEDVLMLVRDQSVTMRDPQQVTERLDDLVHDVEQTEQTVQQVEAIFSDMSPDLDGLMSLDNTSTSSGPNRVRMSN